jgi:hypothetical protein
MLGLSSGKLATLKKFQVCRNKVLYFQMIPIQTSVSYTRRGSINALILDTPSLFRWRHQARLERMAEMKQQKEEVETKKKEVKSREQV